MINFFFIVSTWLKKALRSLCKVRYGKVAVFNVQRKKNIYNMKSVINKETRLFFLFSYHDFIVSNA